jgi:hypothetical protein
MRISLLSIFLLCYCYCVYFHYARLQQKKGKSGASLVLKDYLEVFFVFVGCVDMALLCIFQIVFAVSWDLSGYFSMVELMFAIADTAFVMVNTFASSRLMEFSFKFASGNAKNNQNTILRIFLFVSVACSVFGFISVIGYLVNLVSATNNHTAACDSRFEYLRRTCPWGFMPPQFGWVPVLRILTVSASSVASLFVIFVALRNFDSSLSLPAPSPNDQKNKTIEEQGLKQKSKFGRMRRIAVISSSLLSTLFWFLVAFVILLPQRLSSIDLLQYGCVESDVTRNQCCLDFEKKVVIDDGNPDKTTPELNFYVACERPVIGFAIVVALSPAAAIIRVIAYPICNMLAILSFEIGAKKSITTKSMLDLKTKVRRSESGAAVYRLDAPVETRESEGTRISLDSNFLDFSRKFEPEP